MELSTAHEEHIRELLNDCHLSRDAIPYTEEFGKLKDAFWERSFKRLTDAEFWQCLVNVAKKGGIRGKARVRDTPKLGEDQQETLLRLLPSRLGERDKLPYTEKFHSMVARFNTRTGLSLMPRQVWLATLGMAK